ncbi:excisionase [Scandinavium manionii]|uniref:excisionase n=1 Tax=Scandinavium manionii TaxID=2926520 RepID=UPI002165631D|nr:excisionase [Scandinavium manionii]MCS2147881.1 hypothetical protein [Scandinavium manionii]
MLVSLTDWAKTQFKEPPSAATLRVIAKTRQTYPPAIRLGTRWVIDENAEFIGMAAPTAITPGLSDGAHELVKRALHGS